MKLRSILIKGNQHRWDFHVYGTDQDVEDWRADGFEVWEVENIVPSWIVSLGLLKPYCFLQDLFYWNFK